MLSCFRISCGRFEGEHGLRAAGAVAAKDDGTTGRMAMEFCLPCRGIR